MPNNAFYTRTEAQFFLMKILANEENKPADAMPVARYLASTFPDNAYFQRFYARECYVLGDLNELERVCTQILEKISRGMHGYEEISGRYASFYLGYLNQRRGNHDLAKQYYQQSIRYASVTDEMKSGYTISSFLNLARMADKDKDYPAARDYYKQVRTLADAKSEAEKEAREYLKKKKK